MMQIKIVVLLTILSLTFSLQSVVADSDVTDKQELSNNAPEPYLKVGTLVRTDREIIEAEIGKFWSNNDYKVALAIAKAESGLNPQAKNWNCWYGATSTSCKKEDRGNAYSVDCGVWQINVKGKECPKESFDIKWNVSKAFEMYQERSWSPWVVFKTKAYLTYK